MKLRLRTDQKGNTTYEVTLPGVKVGMLGWAAGDTLDINITPDGRALIVKKVDTAGE